MKKWYIELFVDNGQGGVYHPCGTEYTMLYDDLKTLISSSVIKFGFEAEKYESFEKKKYSDEYLDAVQGLDNFFTYEAYTHDELVAVGITDEVMIAQYIDDDEAREKQRVVVKTAGRGEISSDYHYNIYLSYIDCIFKIAGYNTDLSNFDIKPEIIIGARKKK